MTFLPLKETVIDAISTRGIVPSVPNGLRPSTLVRIDTLFAREIWFLLRYCSSAKVRVWLELKASPLQALVIRRAPPKRYLGGT